MKQKLKVAIVGAGGISRAQHIPGWKGITEAEIVALVDVNSDTAKSVAAEFGIPRVYTDCREMLEGEVDVVDICTPNRMHTPVALAALESGRHVLCEKPLAVTTAEVLQMGRLADRNGLKLMTAQHLRYTSASRVIKQWAESGALGDVYHARVYATRRALLPPSPGFIDSRLSGGGPCMDIGVHTLDTCLWTMGFPKPVRVTGTMKTNFAKGYVIPGQWGEWDRERFDVEDFACGFVHFENGATMTLEASWLGHQEENEDVSFQLFGTGAGVHWPSGRYTSTLGRVFCDGKLTAAMPVERPHHEEIRAFYDSVINNTPSPVPWTETLWVIAILEAIDASSRWGREIEICIEGL